VNSGCTTEGTIIYLDRVAGLACPPNRVLTDFNVRNCGGGAYEMSYYCCSITVQ
jgi:hypothetical protein